MIVKGTTPDFGMKLCAYGFRYHLFSQLSLSIANSLTAASTIVFNFLILISIWRTSSLRKPSHILIANLALADFLVGAVGQPMLVLKNVFLLQKRNEFFGAICFLASVGRAFSYWLTFVSLYTLIAISIDRVLAIQLKTTYHVFVTTKKVLVVLSFGWVSGGITFFVLFIFIEIKTILIVVSVGMVLFMITITVSYLKAVQELRKIMSRVSQADGNTPSTNTSSGFNISKYRRSLNTMLIVFATIMVCCIPYLISTAVIAIDFQLLIDKYIYTHLANSSEVILFANSTMNPLLYLWRMKDIRQAAKKTIASTFGRNAFAGNDCNHATPSQAMTESIP
jgi:hypothetical protein